MSGYMNNDGSQLAGGLQPNGSGKSLQLDALGNLLVAINNTMGNTDGAGLLMLMEMAVGVYNGGGPPLANGTPSQLAFDRVRTWLGKSTQNSAITATNAGDTALAFSAAPKTLLPGQMVKLSGGATAEYVYVSNSFTPSATATSIPLQSPMVNAGQTSAQWDVFNPNGPGAGAVTPAGTLLGVGLVLDVATGNLYAAQGFRGVTDVNVGGRASTAIAAGAAGNTVVKSSPGRLTRILVTATGTNQLTVYDNASTPAGTVIGIVAASAAVGTIVDCQAPAANGITVAGNASNPGITFFYY